MADQPDSDGAGVSRLRELWERKRILGELRGSRDIVVFDGQHSQLLPSSEKQRPGEDDVR